MSFNGQYPVKHIACLTPQTLADYVNILARENNVSSATIFPFKS